MKKIVKYEISQEEFQKIRGLIATVSNYLHYESKEPCEEAKQQIVELGLIFEDRKLI